jgi:hypothetical protein
MAIIDDIVTERDAAVAILDTQIATANRLKNSNAAGMDEKLTALLAQQQAIADQACDAADKNPNLATALADLKAATDEMKGVAQKMVDAATFINNFSSLLGAANKVIPVLQSISKG